MYYEIRTERLMLRPLNIDDLETVHIYASDEENTTYMFWLPNDTKEKTAEFLTMVTEEWKKKQPSFYEFAIMLNEQHIGAISIYLNEERTEGELGWIINKNYWGKGIATEAAGSIKDFSIKELKLNKLIANCDARNINSYKIMKKIGLVLENDNGTRTYPKNGEIAKELTYSLIIN